MDTIAVTIICIYISSSTGSSVHGRVRVVANCDKKIIKIKVTEKKLFYINMLLRKRNKKKCLDSFA